VLESTDFSSQAGLVRFQLVGVKNERPANLLAAGIDLFGAKVGQKVFEIERTVLLPKRSAVSAQR